MGQNRLTIGNWFMANFPEYPTTYFAITDKIPQKYILNEIFKGESSSPWEVQWEDSIIDFTKTVKLNEEALSFCTWAGTMPEEITKQFNDARHHANLYKRYWKI